MLQAKPAELPHHAASRTHTQAQALRVEGRLWGPHSPLPFQESREPSLCADCIVEDEVLVCALQREDRLR